MKNPNKPKEPPRILTEISPEQLTAYKKKVECAGEMKSAIKHFLDWWDWKSDDDSTEHGVVLVADLRKRMEDYLNCG